MPESVQVMRVCGSENVFDRDDRYRSEEICKELTGKHGLYFAQGKENVKIHRLKEPDKTKYEIYDALKKVIPKCRSWAIDNADGKALTGDDLIKFVNNDLIDTLKKLEVDEYTLKKHLVVKYIFEDASNFMKNGVKLRQMINALNEIDFTKLYRST